jgi:hypothetical protein
MLHTGFSLTKARAPRQVFANSTMLCHSPQSNNVTLLVTQEFSDYLHEKIICFYLEPD